MKEQSLNTNLSETNVNEIENKNKNEIKNESKNNKKRKQMTDFKYPMTFEQWDNKMLNDIGILKYKNIEKWDSNIDNCKQILQYLQRAYISQNMHAFDLIWQKIKEFITVLFCFVFFF